jgi:LAO/AO transport system kinase
MIGSINKARSNRMMKAGLIEIADIIVVNKADRGGADRLATEIQAVLSLSGIPKDQVPVLTSEAINSKGIEELYQAIRRYMP